MIWGHMTNQTKLESCLSAHGFDNLKVDLEYFINTLRQERYMVTINGIRFDDNWTVLKQRFKKTQTLRDWTNIFVHNFENKLNKMDKIKAILT